MKLSSIRGPRLFGGRKQNKPAFAPPRFDDLQIFHDVARALTSNLELEPLLREILGLMERFFGPEQWSLLMVDEEKNNELYYALSSGLDTDVLADLRIQQGEGIAGWVAQTGNPLVIPNIEDDPDWRDFSREHPELNLHSIAALPIRHSKRTLGVLMLHNSKLDLLPDNAVSFLRVLCDYTAIALENARQVKLVQHLSITDDCTGLFNSRYLYTMLEGEIATLNDPQVFSIRPNFSLVFFDLDHFKSVNDSNGHLVGSRLLAEIGSLVKRTIGPDHAAFRYGGDEFVVLLRGLNKVDATDLVKHLRETLIAAEFLTGEGMALQIKASFGLATFPEDGKDLYNIIRASDTMMYKAKADGRDCIAVADPDAPQKFVAPRTSRHESSGHR
ncbi:MAG: sensor domain-containing diguanylate cyclase [Acidobacteriaceae bacterium]|nr:sensor domain-containing diguanylate cyclase [Acidobacteriaceae bacterium]